ncbi:MAG: Hsp20/alpha crystallin family protein [Anaerolineae bacterium]|nr:Hsp20/alpha crystallin family protein [Anaerolineae bacterium]
MMLIRQPYYATRQTARPAAAYEPAERVYRLPVDAYATDETVVLTAPVPGMSLEDLEITVDDDELIIRGEINGEEEGVNYLLRERFHGKFERRLRINIPVDVNAAEATYENGVLRLVLPKAEEARPHRIAVNVAH